ncbi:MAG: type II toxin-antitoxin system RelE/ParE family toxin [Vicinamibacterales bacterium]
MYQLQSTALFDGWLRNLGDRKGLARILARLESAQLGNLGDVKGLGQGLREMRVHVGPGYRIYFAQRGRVVLLLLCGGDKASQARDIAKARQILRDLGKE